MGFQASLRHKNKKGIFLNPRQISLGNAFLVNDDSGHLQGCIAKLPLQQHPQVMDLMLVNGNDKYAGILVKQTFGQFKPILDEGQPLAVPAGILAIHIIIIVFPVPRSCIVRRVNIDLNPCSLAELGKKRCPHQIFTHYRSTNLV